MHQEHTSQRAVDPQTAPEAPSQAEPSNRALGLLKDAISSRLFLMTTLGAATGQIPALAANGMLASPGVVVTVGLTVVAGVGAFLAAIEETSLSNERGRRVFGATALLSILVNVAAAGVGVALAHVTSLEHVRYFAALALATIAYEIARGKALTLPRGVPVASVWILAGVVVEAFA